MVTSSRSVRSADLAPSQRMSLAEVSSKGRNLPSRYILHGVEGIGKTSWGAETPSPIFIMTRGETGLETLIDSRQLPDVPHFPEVMDWQNLLSCVEALTTQDHDYKSLVIDTLNGCERLCHEYVCKQQFGGDWGERGFTGYMRGYEASLVDWMLFLNALDRLRESRSVAIVALSHTKVKPFKNPEGSDYDRFQPDMHEKTWGVSHKWADAVFFLNYEAAITTQTDPTKKGKVRKSTQSRIMYTERRAAFDAKNRFGLPAEIEMVDDYKTGWGNFKTALIEAKNRKDS